MANQRNASMGLDKALAAYLLSLGEDDQLLSTRDLAEQFGVSLGSISAALNYLELIGAVSIRRRGRLGSFLERKSLGSLWHIVENRPMVIALTLPSFAKCEGLATALYSLLNGAGVETYLTFIRGSVNRIKALRHGQCHAAVMSALAAEHLREEGEEIALELPPLSFVQEHQVFFRRNRKSTSRPLTVGFDPDSFDVKHLTELEFAGQDVILQPMTFTQIDLHLEDSSVDAAITNSDFMERLTSKQFDSRPLSPQIKAQVGERYTAAAFVTRAGSPTGVVLRETLDPDRVLDIQRQVVEGKLVPRY